MTQRFKYVENNEFGLDVYYDRYKDVTFVEIPRTYVGWGSMVLHKANNRALGQDADRCGQMNIDDMFDVSGTFLGAIVDGYTNEQWELLAELVSDLNEYAIYDEKTYYELEYESQVEAVADMLPYDTDIEAEAVLYAIFELGVLFEEEEGENWYISEQDLNAAIQDAIRNKL